MDTYQTIEFFVVVNSGYLPPYYRKVGVTHTFGVID